MIKFNRFTILLFIAALAFSSCKKKDKVNTCDLTEANFIGSYKAESIKYKLSPTTPEIDGSLIIDACVLDDITTFNADHTFTYIDAGTQCSPPDDDSGTWSLSGNILTFKGKQQFIDIFDCNGFTFSQTDYNTPGDKITVTAKKQ